MTPLEDDCLVRYETLRAKCLWNRFGTYEITEVEGVDGINDQLYPVTHSWKDPVKTVVCRRTSAPCPSIQADC